MTGVTRDGEQHYIDRYEQTLRKRDGKKYCSRSDNGAWQRAVDMCEARGLQLCSVEQYQKAYKKKYTNLALGRPVNQSSTGWNGFAPRAVDGNTSGIYSHGSCTHTYNRGHERWNVQLDGEKNVTEVVLHNRGEGSNHSVGRRLRGARVCVGNTGEVEDCAAAVKTVPSNFHAEFFRGNVGSPCQRRVRLCSPQKSVSYAVRGGGVRPNSRDVGFFQIRVHLNDRGVRPRRTQAHARSIRRLVS